MVKFVFLCLLLLVAIALAGGPAVRRGMMRILGLRRGR